MELIIEAWGEVEFARRLLRFRDRADDMRPAFESVVAQFWAAEAKQFDTEGTYASGGWAPLAQSTIDEKAAMGWDPRILHRTLRLRQSLTGETGDTVRTMTRNELFIGSKVSYGVYHQSTAPRTRLPRRPPVQFTSETKRAFVKTLQRFLTTGKVQ